MLEVTVKGTAAEIKEFWAVHYGNKVDGTLQDFLSHLTPDGKHVVSMIADMSNTGWGISRTTLQEELQRTAGEMNGILGGVGRSWARTFNQRANPFSATDPEHSGGNNLHHQIDRSLAIEVLALVSNGN